MATDLNDVLSAIDAYMANNGTKTTGPYLATKISEIFDNDDSPLNAKKGPLSKIGEKMKKLYDKADKAADKLEDLIKNTSDIGKKMKSLSGKITSFVKTIDNIEKNIKKLNVPARRMMGTGTANISKLARTIGFYVERVFRKVVGTKLIPEEKANRKILRQMLTTLRRILNKKPKTTTAAPAILSKKEDKMVEYLRQIKDSTQKSNTLLGKILKQKQQIEVQHTSKEEYNENRPKSLLARIFGFLFKAALGLGFLYVLFRFLNETPAGKIIKEKIKKFAHKFGDWLEDQFKSGKITEIFTTIFDGLKRASVFVLDGLMNFIDKNHDVIWETIKNIGVSFRDKFIYPVFDKMWNIVKNIFSEQNFDFAKDGILGTIWKGIKAAGKSVFVIGGAWMIARTLPIIRGPFRLLEKIIRPLARLSFKGLRALGRLGFRGLFALGKLGFRGLFALGRFAFGGILAGLRGLAGILLGNPLGLAITAAVAAFGFLGKSIYDFVQTNKKFTELSEENIKKSQKAIDFLDKRLNQDKTEIEQAKEKEKEDPTRKTYLERKRAEFTAKLDSMNKEFEEKRKAEEKRFLDLGWRKSLRWNASSHVERLKKINEEFEEKQEKFLKNSKFKDMMDELHELEAKDKKLKSTSLETPKLAVNDAIIVEPHAKDQIIMGKGGGPFDMAFKDLSKKFDLMMQIMANGMASVASTTAQGSGQIVQAIATSSNGGGGGGASSDPIEEFRSRARSHIENLNR